MTGASTPSKRKQEPEEPLGAPPPWIVSFACLMILMLAFFIVLVSYGTMETGKIVQFVGSFRGSLNILPGGVKTELSEEVVKPSREITIEVAEARGFVSKVNASEKKRGFKKRLGLTVTSSGVGITISDYLLFGLKQGRADIDPDMKPFLNDLAELIRDTSYLVRIEGHTDDTPVSTEQFPSNWELSAARAISILKYFVGEGGISPLRVSAAGHGGYRPLFSNDTPEHRAGNRRIMIYLEKNELETHRYKDKMISKVGVLKSL
jgi:chemotaxis protein MotB